MVSRRRSKRGRGRGYRTQVRHYGGGTSRRGTVSWRQKKVGNRWVNVSGTASGSGTMSGRGVAAAVARYETPKVTTKNGKKVTAGEGWADIMEYFGGKVDKEGKSLLNQALAERQAEERKWQAVEVAMGRQGQTRHSIYGGGPSGYAGKSTTGDYVLFQTPGQKAQFIKEQKALADAKASARRHFSAPKAQGFGQWPSKAAYLEWRAAQLTQARSNLATMRRAAEGISVQPRYTRRQLGSGRGSIPARLRLPAARQYRARMQRARKAEIAKVKAQEQAVNLWETQSQV